MQDAELATEHPVDAVRNVDFHLAACRQHPDCAVDQRRFLGRRIGKFRNRDLELGVLAVDRIDTGFDPAIVGDLVGDGLDLRVGRKGDAEGIIGIAVFLPVLRGGGAGHRKYHGNECHRNEGEQPHRVRSTMAIDSALAGSQTERSKRPAHSRQTSPHTREPTAQTAPF